MRKCQTAPCGRFLIGENKCQTSKIIEFHKIVEKLGQVKRDVKLSDGSYESDLSHILKVAYLAFAAAPYLQTKVDTTKMLSWL